jgi:hypothetical protein
MLMGVIVAVAVIGFGGLWLAHTIFKPKPQALQDAIVKQFGGKPGAVMPNVPSRKGRYPGAVLAVSPNGSELLVRSMDRPEVPPPASGSLSGVELVSQSAVWELAGRAFGGKVEGKGDATVHLDLKEIRIFEEEAGKLAEALRNSEPVGRARGSGQPIVVITKSYEAIPTVTVRQRSDAKSEDWAKLKGELTKANGRITTDDAVEFKSSSAQVVAYETSEVGFISDNFAPGGVKIELQAPRLAWTAAPFPRPTDFGAKRSKQDVAFTVISSPLYSSQSFGDLPAATASASLVGGLFEAAGARRLDCGLSVSDRLTENAFTAGRKKLVDALKAQKPTAFVLYYVGHAVSGMSGAHYLVMGDYAGNLTNDLKQSSPFVAARGPTHPLSGSNIDDIAKVVAAAGQELASSQSGLVAVADLYRDLSETGVPFTIVVDGCYPADAMTQLEKQLAGMFWWAGDGDSKGRGITADVLRSQEYQRAIRTYGEAPYLRADNPVIFAAIPGMFAPVVKNPVYQSDTMPGVGPLAAKLYDTFSESLINRTPLSLGDWLRAVSDFSRNSEPNKVGSISWSNFDALGNVAVVNFN